MRWDETWHRLRDWTDGQAKSERLAAQILLSDGYRRLDPSHPLGGPDGGKDALVERGDESWVMAAYFPHGQKPFSEIVGKFTADFAGVSRNAAAGLAFVTNQRLTLEERSRLLAGLTSPVDIYHLERITTILDQPNMSNVRLQFLGINFSDDQLEPINATVSDLVKAISASGSGGGIGVGSGASPNFVGLLVGREDEVAQITTSLGAEGRNSTSRTFVITGLGGVGKTHLGRTIAANCIESGIATGGAIFVDFRGYDLDRAAHVAPEQVFGPLIRMLSNSEPEHELSKLASQYHSVLAALEGEGRRVLLVLDNVSDLGQVSSLLPNTPHLVLITTRNSLAPMLDGATELRLEPLDSHSSVELLKQRTIPKLEDTSSDEPSYETLAALCGHLPLALRIVNAILRSDAAIRVRDLVEELTSEADRLSAIEHEDWAVRPALLSSYVRLQSADARVFRLLSLHPGTNYTAESIAHLCSLSRPVASRTLRHLVNANLLERREGESLFGMHDLARLYAAEVVEGEEYEQERRAARRDLFEYFMQRTDDAAEMISAEKIASREFFQSRESATAWLHAEVDSILACVPVAMEAAELEVAAHLALSISGFLSLRRDFAAALSALEFGCVAARKLEESRLELGALNNLGLSLSSLGRYDEAKRVFQEGRRLARRLGDRGEEATMLVGLAEVVRNEGFPKSSLGTLRRAVKLRLDTNDVERVGYALTNLAISLRESGLFQDAVVVLLEARRYHDITGDNRALASTLGHLGTALHQAGAHSDEATEPLREAMRLYELVGDLNGRAMGYMNLGNVLQGAGKVQEAKDCYAIAVAAFVQTGDENAESLALRNQMSLGVRMQDEEIVSRAATRLRELGSRG